MWLHLLEQGAFCYITEPLCAYRRHDRQQTEKEDKLTLTTQSTRTNLASSHVTS